MRARKLAETYIEVARAGNWSTYWDSEAGIFKQAGINKVLRAMNCPQGVICEKLV